MEHAPAYSKHALAYPKHALANPNMPLLTPNMPLLTPNMPLLTPTTPFHSTFVENCGRGESFGTTTYPKTVVGGKQMHVGGK